MITTESHKIDHDWVRTRTRMAGDVVRYHEWPTTRKQTVAEHSWNCMRIYLEVFRPNLGPGGDEAGRMLMYLLYHDCGELGTGDLPYPIKRDNPDLKAAMTRVELSSLAAQGVVLPDLTEWETMVAKVCDMLEMFEFGLEEMRRGNVYGKPIMDVTEEYIVGVLHKPVSPRLHSDGAQALRTYFHRLTGRYLP